MGYTYGSRTYSAGVYGGLDYPFLSSFPQATINVYDNTGARKGTFQSGVGDFIGCEFTLTEKGCSDFSLQFGKYVNINKKDIVKIRVYDSIDVFFTGVVRIEPIQGSTETNYIYSGYGLIDYLVRMNAGSRSYTNKTIEYIINDLLDNVITIQAPINKNVGKMIFPGITFVSYEINYSQISEVIDSLVKVASSSSLYIAGVDRDGDFYFYPRSEETIETLIVGAEGRRGIDSYNPEDSIESRTAYYLLDKDGVFITSVNSVLENDIYEEKITAPDIDDAAAINWAQGILVENEIVTRSASITWKIEKQSPVVLVANGNLRIISSIMPGDAEPPVGNPYGSGTYGSGLYGGSLYSGYYANDILQIIQVTYTLRDNDTTRKIQLGSRPPQLDEEIMAIRKNLTDLRVSLGR